jgi:RimJ/RimL family protein N-acetyltransferase
MGDEDPFPRIETERLVLRAPVASDAERIARLANDYDVVKMTGSMPFPYTRADAEAYLARVERRDATREAVFAIDQIGEGLVGVIGFHPRDDSAPEIGYWFGRPYWGKGLATETVSAALDWARKDWRKRHITAGHFADNPTSGRVLEKTGFLYTGVIRTIHSVARGEPTPSRMMVWLA